MIHHAASLRIPHYEELEKMLQADHLKDFGRAENQAQYQANLALLDQVYKERDVTVSQIDQREIPLGLPASGQYFYVPKGLYRFLVQVMGDDMKMAFAAPLTD